MTRADNSSFTSALANQFSSWALSQGPKAQAVVVSTGCGGLHRPCSRAGPGHRGGKKRRVAGKGNHVVCRSGQPQPQANRSFSQECLGEITSLSSSMATYCKHSTREETEAEKEDPTCLQNTSYLLPTSVHISGRTKTISPRYSIHPPINPQVQFSTQLPAHHGLAVAEARVVLGQSRESIVKQTCPQN